MAQMRKQSQPTVYPPRPSTLSQHQFSGQLRTAGAVSRLPSEPREERDHWEEGADASLGHTFRKHGLGQDTLVPRKLLSRFASKLVFSKGSRLLSGEEKVCVEGRVLGMGRGLLGVSVQCLERSGLSEKGWDMGWGGDKTLMVQGAFEEQKEKGPLASAHVNLRLDAAVFFPILTELVNTGGRGYDSNTLRSGQESWETGWLAVPLREADISEHTRMWRPERNANMNGIPPWVRKPVSLGFLVTSACGFSHATGSCSFDISPVSHHILSPRRN